MIHLRRRGGTLHVRCHPLLKKNYSEGNAPSTYIKKNSTCSCGYVFGTTRLMLVWYIWSKVGINNGINIGIKYQTNLV